jgi:hypothetical protein
MTGEPDDPNWKPGQKNPEGWHEWICDPRNKTMTHLLQTPKYFSHYARTLPASVSARNGKVASTDIFNWWRYTAAGRENLGEEVFESLPAHRYRARKTYPPRSLYENADADGLALQLLQSIRYLDPPVVVETRLTNIRLSEPSKNLLALPAWAWSQADPMPAAMAPPGMMLGVP